ncbi:MAG: hypothetical protein QGG54_12385 [Gammaproteobacteria bacterium]|jgi:hypothetical protein|nr:hypothetical protein [Gammaproteobacteria bacterium]|tara:strand:- start:451 stop:705 length:255 start_codon:yes stop_codon:yes gene_type:complete
MTYKEAVAQVYLDHFLDSMCEIDIGAEVPEGAAYLAYGLYCRSVNAIPVEEADFEWALKLSGIPCIFEEAGYLSVRLPALQSLL